MTRRDLLVLVFTGTFFLLQWPTESIADVHESLGQTPLVLFVADHSSGSTKSQPTKHKTNKASHKKKSPKHAAHKGKKGKSAHGKHAKSTAKGSAPNAKKKTAQVGIFTAYTYKGRGKKAKHPQITADQTNLKDHDSCVVANNRLPIGTKIKIEGVGTCEVRDRLSKRASSNHFDIHMKSDPKWAKQFGKRRLAYAVVD